MGGMTPGMLLCTAVAACCVCCVAPDTSAAAFFVDPYDYAPRRTGEFEALHRRAKRRPGARRVARETFPLDDSVDDDDDTVDKLWKNPDDVEVDHAESANGNATTDHIYYTMTITSGDVEKTNKYFVDVEKMLEKPGVTGNKSHPLLSNSYRRAVGTKLSFDFPFYGHRMSNVTIATGGFCYIGDQTHSWLAATQYIAPLMANFDTQLDGSNILYADDGEKFVVEWRRVQLRAQKQAGPFTFQAILHKNGDMHFVYKDVPMDVSNISDAHHPCKMGISDAYLFHHAAAGQFTTVSKRVIYEYHRIEIKPDKVTSNTVIELKAQPTCMNLTTCAECANTTLARFNCSWCHAKRAHGGPFCTDNAGLHRRRQQFIEGNCKDQRKTIYCPDDDEENYKEVEEESTPSPSGSSPPPPAPEGIVPLDTKTTDAQPHAVPPPHTGWTSIFLLLTAVVVALGWLTYAYYNPHTTSGQLLIKYRPSRWHVPNSHVRYSASVHM